MAKTTALAALILLASPFFPARADTTAPTKIRVVNQVDVLGPGGGELSSLRNGTEIRELTGSNRAIAGQIAGFSRFVYTYGGDLLKTLESSWSKPIGGCAYDPKRLVLINRLTLRFDSPLKGTVKLWDSCLRREIGHVERGWGDRIALDDVTDPFAAPVQEVRSWWTSSLGRCLPFEARPLGTAEIDESLTDLEKLGHETIASMFSPEEEVAEKIVGFFGCAVRALYPVNDDVPNPAEFR